MSATGFEQKRDGGARIHKALWSRGTILALGGVQTASDLGSIPSEARIFLAASRCAPLFLVAPTWPSSELGRLKRERPAWEKL